VFEVFLPAQKEAAGTAAVTALPTSPANGEQILIVDDEPDVSNVLKLVLCRAGYRATAFTDPQAALNAFLSRPAEVSLILTDLTMPSMTGLELARKVFEIRSDLPVILATGFGGDLVAPEQFANQPNIRRVIEKPLNPDIVIGAVAEVLYSNRQDQGE
jgi:CheY-like chemotaxis protein